MDNIECKDLAPQLDRIEGKVDTLYVKVADLDKGLAVHKVKTGRVSMIVGAIASLLVAVAAVLLNSGC